MQHEIRARGKIGEKKSQLRSTVSLSIVEWILLIALTFSAVLSLMHFAAGAWVYWGRAFVKKFNISEETETHFEFRALLVSFFIIVFFWLQSIAFSLGLLFTENPLGLWFGLIGIFGMIPVVLFMLRYVSEHYLALSVFGFQLLSYVIWTADYVARG